MAAVVGWCCGPQLSRGGMDGEVGGGGGQDGLAAAACLIGYEDDRVL